MQPMHAYERKAADANLLIRAKHNPPTPPKPGADALEMSNWYAHITSWQKAYNVSELDASIRAREAAALASADMWRAALAVRLAALRASGALRPDVVSTDGNIGTCLMKGLNPEVFLGAPAVSLVLQSYGRPWAIPTLVARARACLKVLPCELVVNVDCPAEAVAWVEAAKNESRGDWVIPIVSNGIGEAPGFNRLIDLARGKLVVLLGDDTPLPQDCGWLRDVAAVFHGRPQVGMVGLHTFSFGTIADKSSGTRFREPTSGIPVQFVATANRAPVVVRRAAMLSVGGMDESLGHSPSGLCTGGAACGHGLARELSIRMWVGGWHVMHYAVSTGGEGTLLEPIGNSSAVPSDLAARGTPAQKGPGGLWDGTGDTARYKYAGDLAVLEGAVGAGGAGGMPAQAATAEHVVGGANATVVCRASHMASLGGGTMGVALPGGDALGAADALLAERYGKWGDAFFKDLAKRVRDLNLGQLHLVAGGAAAGQGSACPFADGCARASL